MSTPMKKPAAAKEPVPNPDVMTGDEVYFRHAKGPHAARVLATGKHGITVHHEGKPHPVRWEHVLGHKTRKAQKYDVLDEGEDGLIVKDAAGQRKYITVPPEARGEQMVLAKAMGAGAPRMVMFAKAGPIANRPGLSLQPQTDKNGVQTKHWVRTNKELPKGDSGAAPEAGKKPPSHVKFENGEHKGSGKVISSGTDGHTVEDAAGGRHQVRHEHVTHEFHGKDAPNQDPVDAKKFSAADYAKMHDDPDVTADSLLDSFGDEAKKKVEATKAKLADVKLTDQEHSKGGIWTDERRELHRKLLFDGVEIKGKKVPGLLAADRVKAATPAKGHMPVFVALGGRGGSGKSSLNGKVYNEANAIVLDADHIKGMLPEYDGWNAHAVHEESSHVLETVLRMAKLLGVNVVLDATMKTGKTIAEKVDEFKSVGYRTEAHYMHLPRQEAAKRAFSRYLNGGEKGRYVPPEVVLGNTNNEENFDAIKHKVDAWSFHDNNVPKGEQAKLISQHGDPALVPKKMMTKALRSAKILLWRK